MTGSPTAHHVAPGEGDRLEFQGTVRLMKLAGRDTDGHLCVYESSYSAGDPSPLHIHHDAVESFFVLDGTCRFRVGDELMTVGPGSFVSVPRGATHGVVAVGGPARALVMFSPAAMEGYWEEVAAASADGTLDQAMV